MTPFKKFSRFPKAKKMILSGTLILSLSGAVLVQTGCGDSVEYTTEEQVTYTKGLITTVKETKKDLFKITDETIVENKADSRIIANYMDGTSDTFTLEEARLVDADNPRRRGVNSVVMGGFMGYYMGKSMSTPVNRGAYAKGAYEKVNNKAGKTLNSTAKRTSVRKPKKSYGKSRSTRSYGG